ncbi:unnamed protein product [Rhodiola kirilowii]
MREEVISSGGNIDPTPAASSAGASSPAVPANQSRIDLSNHGYGSKAAALARIGSPQRRTSLSTNAGGSALGSSHTSCRPWERGDLLRRLATFKPSNWFGNPKVKILLLRVHWPVLEKAGSVLMLTKLCVRHVVYALVLSCYSLGQLLKVSL